MLLTALSHIHGQEKCAIKPFQDLQKHHLNKVEDPEEFEKWISEKIRKMKASTPFGIQAESEVVTIPVVVHIIHEGEPLGSGTNLPAGQVLSQIEVLNEDFRRLNDDRVSTPDVFQPVAADIEINFVLAVRDPEGLPTNGIVRVNGGRNIWQLTDNYSLKNLSYWPSEDYLNIWVADLNDNYLGYAQFPVSPLAGLDIASENAFTDGVIIDYRAFGSVEKYPEANLISNFNLGRTTTHEVGHFFGLRHIWGDGGCDADDFCNDTPLQGSPNTNYGEPCEFPGPNSCTTGSGDLPDMFQNYMDYTPDACMNLFTIDQRFRMRAVLDESPRRASLKNSPGKVMPVQYDTDLGIRSITNPSTYACPDPLIPSLEVRNYGTEQVNTFIIEQEFNGTPIGSETLTISLAPLESAVVSMPAFQPDQDGTLAFRISSVNNGSDENILNNEQAIDLYLSQEVSGPFEITFNELPSNWIIENPDGLVKWEVEPADNGTGFNEALTLNFFDYENFGELDLFVSPVIDLTEATTASLVFDVAYSGYPSAQANFEGLMVTATDACSSPVFGADTVFYKLGAELRTRPTQSSVFRPQGAGDWRTEVVNLMPYLGSKVRLAFVGINGFGNDLFIDNIRVDLGAAIRLESPGPAYCIDLDPPLVFSITNTTTEAWNYFELQVRIDNTRIGTFVYNDLLPAGESTDLTIDIPSLTRGYHLAEGEIMNINNSGENIGEQGRITRQFITSDKEILIPFREDFEDYDPEFPEAWLPLGQPGTPGWEITTTGFGDSFVLQNQNNNVPGDHDYLISPRFSLERFSEAFLTFDLAYRRFNDSFDSFSVLLSTNCGLSYDEVLFTRTGSELGSDDFDGEDSPSINSDWEKITINMSNYAGLSDLKLAFLGVNGNGGSLFVDNIEFFINDPVVADNGTIFTNPTVNGFFKVTFNRPEREDISIRLMDMTGRVVLEKDLNGVLNQTYEFDVNYLKQGIYILQVEGETFSLAKRLIHAYF